MLTVGVDAHKKLHVAVVLDTQGRQLSIWRGTNSERGWASFSQWLEQFEGDRRIGIEGAWSYGRGLARFLVARGETVFEVNARWTAAGRQRAMKPDKNDALDANAIALHVHREADALVPLTADDETAVLDLLALERDAAVGEATRLRNQMHALLMQLDPQYQRDLPAMKSQAGLSRLLEYTTSSELALDQARAESVRRLAQRLALALQQIDELTDQVKRLAAPRFTPLTRLVGVNLLTAGVLAGILGPAHRFKSDAALAAYAGAAPREASSAGRVRHRLNRGGNRRLNAVLYRIALTQAHFSPQARAYLARRAAEGKTRREAMRALKRFLVRAIWKLWQDCYPSDAGHSAPVQAGA